MRFSKFALAPSRIPSRLTEESKAWNYLFFFQFRCLQVSSIFIFPNEESETNDEANKMQFHHMSCNSSVVAICLWCHKMFSPHPSYFAADSLFAISPASQYTLLLGLICQYLFSSFIIPFYLKKMDQIYAREISFWSVIVCLRYSNLKSILFTKINCKPTDLRQNNGQLLQAERAFVNISRCHLEIIIFIFLFRSAH